jgi:hypothetical protein
MATNEERAAFFISYTAADVEWARWVAWILEENNFLTKFQECDFRPGSNFVLEMDRAAASATKTIAILSPDYLKSAFGSAEWAAAFGDDPQGFRRKLVPVRVRECEAEGLLGKIVYIDLVGKSEDDAREVLLKGIIGQRAKPRQKPTFPGSRETKPSFPGERDAAAAKAGRYIPKIESPPSDLDMRRFVHRAFKTIKDHFESCMAELGLQKGVEMDLRDESAKKFSAEIFVNGQSRRRCEIWLEDDKVGYFEGPFNWPGSGHSYNEMLSVVPRKLALAAVMKMGWGEEERGLDLDSLAPDDAAEYLWRRFAASLNRR